MDLHNKILQILKEHPAQVKNLVGCDFFESQTYDYKWCKFAENKLQRNTKKVSDAMSNYVKEFLSSYKSGIRAVKYDKSLPFFSERRDMVVDSLEKFQQSCPKLRKHIIDQMIKFTDKYVIWNEENQYDLLNKLNTNYTAVAFLLTSELPENYKTAESFEDAIKYFFETKNDDGVTPFETFMGRIGTENKEIIRDRIYQTIKQKTKEGNIIEDKFYEYMSNQIGGGNIIVYSGDYSFMDMIGIDMIVKDPNGVWIPVQVKKWVSGCDDKTISYARKSMCENWCVSNESKYFNIKVYNGERLEKSKKQCKTTSFDFTTFLNIHGDPGTEKSSEYCRDIPED
jgi:hypothetical protein